MLFNLKLMKLKSNVNQGSTTFRFPYHHPWASLGLFVFVLGCCWTSGFALTSVCKEAGSCSSIIKNAMTEGSTLGKADYAYLILKFENIQEQEEVTNDNNTGNAEEVVNTGRGTIHADEKVNNQATSNHGREDEKVGSNDNAMSVDSNNQTNISTSTDEDDFAATEVIVNTSTRGDSDEGGDDEANTVHTVVINLNKSNPNMASHISPSHSGNEDDDEYAVLKRYVSNEKDEKIEKKKEDDESMDEGEFGDDENDDVNEEEPEAKSKNGDDSDKEIFDKHSSMDVNSEVEFMEDTNKDDHNSEDEEDMNSYKKRSIKKRAASRFVHLRSRQDNSTTTPNGSNTNTSSNSTLSGTTPPPNYSHRFSQFFVPVNEYSVLKLSDGK